MAISINNNSKPIPVKQNSAKSGDYIPRDYKNVAEGMESQFADYMITEMKKTVNRDDDNPESQAEAIYDGFLNNERAKTLSETQGLGIKKLILDQIYPEHLRTKLAYDHHLQSEKMKREMINPNAVKIDNRDQAIVISDPNGQGGLK